ncbi:MAG: lytic murein transglycosylase, partial [Pseudomonadota bacterium]
MHILRPQRLGARGVAGAVTLLLISFGGPGASSAHAEASASFQAWKQDLRSEAIRAGVRGDTFDQVMSDVTINRRAPDLARPSRGKKKLSNRGQAEFTRPPQAYLNAKQLARLAARGRKLAAKHRGALAQIERELRVPRAVVLAIWGRETAFGGWRLRNDAINALTTQAWLGRRQEMFREELIYALRMIDEPGITRAKMRSSWAGAVGLTQFMPSEFYSTAYDLDRDGFKDLWSPPDALASAANQLKLKGWVPGRPWGIEIKLGGAIDCAMAGPQNTKTIGEWAQLGARRHDGKPFTADQKSWPAYLLVAGGTYGPMFLVTENYVVFRRYNLSDLYALFVGDLANRIAGRGTFRARWADLKQVRAYELADIQQRLKDKGFGITIVDGKLGSNTRSQIGLYQRSVGQTPD